MTTGAVSGSEVMAAFDERFELCFQRDEGCEPCPYPEFRT
jgi:hypothetical protein